MSRIHEALKKAEEQRAASEGGQAEVAQVLDIPASEPLAALPLAQGSPLPAAPAHAAHAVVRVVIHIRYPACTLRPGELVAGYEDHALLQRKRGAGVWHRGIPHPALAALPDARETVADGSC